MDMLSLLTSPHQDTFEMRCYLELSVGAMTIATASGSIIYKRQAEFQYHDTMKNIKRKEIDFDAPQTIW